MRVKLGLTGTHSVNHGPYGPRTLFHLSQTEPNEGAHRGQSYGIPVWDIWHASAAVPLQRVALTRVCPMYQTHCSFSFTTTHVKGSTHNSSTRWWIRLQATISWGAQRMKDCQKQSRKRIKAFSTVDVYRLVWSLAVFSWFPYVLKAYDKDE